jgi:hypothetical protein
MGGPLVLCPGATASEDRVAKREMCQLEAKERFKPRPMRSVEVFQQRVERRMASIRECMERPFDDRVTTGSVTRQAAPPLPPPRPKGTLK